MTRATAGTEGDRSRLTGCLGSGNWYEDDEAERQHEDVVGWLVGWVGGWLVGWLGG